MSRESDRLRVRDLLKSTDIGQSESLSHLLMPLITSLQHEAWDEGYRARKGEGWESPGADNPYEVTP